MATTQMGYHGKQEWRHTHKRPVKQGQICMFVTEKYSGNVTVFLVDKLNDMN